MPKSVQEYLKMGFDLPMARYFASGRRTIVKVIAHKDYSLELIFDNGERRKYDVTPLLKYKIWQPLRKWENFSRVFLDDFHAPAWDIDPNIDSSRFINNRLDICPDSSYVDSVPYDENI